MTVAFPMRGDARRVQRANVTPRVALAPRYASRFWSVIVPADGTSAATSRSGDFGTSRVYMGSSRTSYCSPYIYIGRRT
jgi:hypothetical protein